MPTELSSGMLNAKLFASLRCGLVVFDSAHNYIEANQAARELLQLHGINDLGPYAKSIEDFIQTGIDGHFKQLIGIAGKPVNGTLHRIEDRIVLEVSESYETKLGEASHELRRPLANIKTLVDTLHLWGAGEDPDARKKFLGQLHSQVERMVKLVNELLELSRIQSGTVPLHIQQLALSYMVAEAMEQLSQQAMDKGVELINEVPKDFVMVGDIDKLAHVVQNLIENAIRYNRSGGTVTIRPAKEPNAFEVIDTGSGISKENLSLIFERFRRINKEIPGTGLGLAIAKSIVDLHGGTITVESEIGNGSTFRVILPKRAILLPPGQ